MVWDTLYSKYMTIETCAESPAITLKDINHKMLSQFVVIANKGLQPHPTLW